MNNADYTDFKRRLHRCFWRGYQAESVGFTLIELMIAATVLAVALVALLGVLISNFRLIDSGRNLTIAINHGQAVMEEIRDFNIPSVITAQDWTSWAQADSPDGGGCSSLDNESVQVAYPSGVAASPLEIVVTVNWTERGRPKNTQLATWLTER